ncbi:hypothetical protein [Paenibacillus elgii]
MGNLNTIFSNVNLNRIDFIGGRPDIKFEFIDSIHGSHKYSGEIVCKHILVFKMDTSFEIEDDFPFPCFLCDVIVSKLEEDNIQSMFDKLNYGYRDVPKATDYYLIKMMGGDIGITIICNKVEINKV